MAVPREIVLERERRAWELRCQGWTHARIAVDLGVDPSTVTKLLGRLSARYAKAHAADVDAVKGAQLAQLEHIADEAMQGWRRSIGAIEIVTRKSTTIKLGAGETAQELPGEEVTTRMEVKAGETAYLGEARGALADMRKILGLDAPTKAAIEQTGTLKIIVEYADAPPADDLPDPPAPPPGAGGDCPAE